MRKQNLNTVVREFFDIPKNKFYNDNMLIIESNLTNQTHWSDMTKKELIKAFKETTDYMERATIKEVAKRKGFYTEKDFPKKMRSKFEYYTKAQLIKAHKESTVNVERRSIRNVAKRKRNQRRLD